MSKLNIIKDVLLTCIFIILGIPLIIVSTQSSDVLENSNQLPNDNDVACILVKKIKDSENIKIKSLLKQDNSTAIKMNSVRTCSFIIGIILLSIAFINIILLLKV